MSNLPIEEIQNQLIRWGSDNYQNYIWRDLSDPWLGMLSEILLQRTNVRHVEAHFEEIVASFPTASSVTSASNRSLKLIEQRFGLDRRINTVLAAARYLEQYKKYPKNAKELTEIFGIGHYTAAAYLSFHAGIRAVLIDSNVARWLSRMTGLDYPGNIRSCKWLWELAEKLTPQNDHKKYNYAVLDFTIKVCKVRSPLCGSCPLLTTCAWGNSN